VSWLKSDQSLRDHPKKDHLAELLFNGTTPNDVADFAAAGVLHYLWYWALDYAQDGDLAKFSDRQVAKGCRWQGDSVTLVQALITAGFIDADRKIHDWDDWAGLLILRRERNATQMRRARAESVDTTCTPRVDLEESRKSRKKERARENKEHNNQPVDNSTVRPVVASGQEPERTCWRCGHPISGDAILDDLAVLSSKGIRHKECAP